MTEPFEPFAGRSVAGSLCNQPGVKGVAFECVLEGGLFASQGHTAADEVVVLAYNVERGIMSEDQLATLADDPGIPSPDIVLLSEADRRCTRSRGVNVAEAYAQALRMNYVYGVEFVELPRWIGPNGRIDAPCEHGNAILSRYPIGNVRLIRHEKNRGWSSWWQRLFRVGEPRMGGRMALAADVDLGEQLLRVYSVHFESQGGDEYRPAQAAEVGVDGVQMGGSVVIGGDMNFAGYRADLENGQTTDEGVQSLLDLGYADAHGALPVGRRITTRSGSIVDCIFVRGVEVAERGVGDARRWGDLSDHLPVWARISVGGE